ncbi:MAG: cobalt ECF transporter T component CbiQ [Chlorobiaceae bacterium]|nr:cobalt ECF transporter T component CbiQ [Chlorobiaceae bacterium]
MSEGCLQQNPAEHSLPAGDRAILAILVIFIVFVVGVPKDNLPTVIAYGGFPLFVITALRLPFRLIMKRLVMLSPFVIFMAAGNLYFDQQPIFKTGGVQITGGMISAGVIAAKSFVTLSALLLFSHSVPFHRFGNALRAYGVPEMFATQLQLVYRYSFLLGDEARSLQKARDLRSFGRRGKDIRTTAQLIGSLLVRAFWRAESIYMAMSARGFGNSIPIRHFEPFTTRDGILVAAATLGFFAVRIIFLQ